MTTLLLSPSRGPSGLLGSGKIPHHLPIPVHEWMPAPGSRLLVLQGASHGVALFTLYFPWSFSVLGAYMSFPFFAHRVETRTRHGGGWRVEGCAMGLVGGKGPCTTIPSPAVTCECFVSAPVLPFPCCQCSCLACIALSLVSAAPHCCLRPVVCLHIVSPISPVDVACC